MSSVEFDNLPFRERPDLTPYLIHLTKRSNESISAFDNLVSILKSGVIKGSGSRGFVKGPNKAACWMDVPFSALKYLLKKADVESEKPKYEPYGIFITKKTAYKQSARPVMYLSNSEVQVLGIPEAEIWRVVWFEASDEGWISWIHEREWRAKGDFKLPGAPVGVLVKTSAEARELSQLIADSPQEFKVKPKSILPLNIVCQGLIY